jgi:hypothetical protein
MGLDITRVAYKSRPTPRVVFPKIARGLPGRPHFCETLPAQPGFPRTLLAACFFRGPFGGELAGEFFETLQIRLAPIIVLQAAPVP